MDISLIICTYNRAENLRNTFESLLKMDLPLMSSFELILVDNNSNDSTRDVATQFKSSANFPVRYFFEEKQGLSHARNRGVKEANGDILAFTDDDVEVRSDWLKEIEKIFSNNDIACAGGKVFPLWEKECPGWLTKDLYKYLALRDLGNESIQLSECILFGANLIIRSAMFKKYGLFDTNIGRTKDKLYAGEETEFIERLITGGEKIYYIPNLVVYHLVPASRMDKKYFRKWIRDNSKLQANRLGTYTNRNIVGVPLYFFRQLIDVIIKYLTSQFTFKNQFYNELQLIRSITMISERIKFWYLTRNGV